MNRLQYLILLVTLCGCQNLEPVEISQYFDMDSLVTAQFDEIKPGEARLTKETSFNAKTDVHTIRPDSAQWANELQIFRRANINKPVLRGVYSTTKKDNGPNVILTYLPTDEKERLVKELKIIRSKSSGHLVRIEAIIFEKNPLYGTRRKLAMNFDENDLLTSYKVSGGQKMKLTDSVNFIIDATIER